MERLGDSVPLFRIKTRTPAISSQRKKPLWASFEERRQTEEKEEEEAARREVATEHHVTESEGYLALDLKHDFQNTQESEKFGDFSSSLSLHTSLIDLYCVQPVQLTVGDACCVQSSNTSSLRRKSSAMLRPLIPSRCRSWNL